MLKVVRINLCEKCKQTTSLIMLKFKVNASHLLLRFDDKLNLASLDLVSENAEEGWHILS